MKDLRMLKSMLVEASCPLRRLLIKRSEESREIEGKGVLVIDTFSNIVTSSEVESRNYTNELGNG